MILVIDNYDSFTWNLVQRLGELGTASEIRVVRNDEVTIDEIESLAPERIIISPGPCTPREAGISNGVVRAFGGRLPLLGVCLGHQCIGFTDGCEVSRHTRLMHGKTSEVHHDGEGLFAGLSNPFVATRYHSLVIPIDSVNQDHWKVSAWLDEDGERVVMGLRRNWAPSDVNTAPLEGVQFHPESFLTTEGPRLLRNFLSLGTAASTVS